MSLIKLSNIKKYFVTTDSTIKALDGITLEIEKGEMVAIVGESGCGKTTLLNIIGLLDRQDSGDYFLDNVLVDYSKDSSNAKLRNEKIGLVFQDYCLIQNESPVFNAMLPLYFTKMSLSKMKQAAKKALSEVGFPETHLKHKVKFLSGGQKQRVAIARALVNNPDIILADEPTGALDKKSTREIMELLRELNQKGKTIIMVTHDENLAAECGRVIKL